MCVSVWVCVCVCVVLCVCVGVCVCLCAGFYCAGQHLQLLAQVFITPVCQWRMLTCAPFENVGAGLDCECQRVQLFSQVFIALREHLPADAVYEVPRWRAKREHLHLFHFRIL